MRSHILSAAALLASALVFPAQAADTVKIGVIYPLTGNAAPAGNSAKDAVELGLEIVNNAHPELKGLPLAETAGLSNLGGAKIELISADHQGNLARVYLAAGNRKKALEAVEAGLKMHPEDEYLLSVRKSLGVRARPPVPFLDRSNPINVSLGMARHNKKIAEKETKRKK